MILLAILVSLHLVNPNPLLPGARIANFCSCNGQVNSKGEGECTSSYRGRPFCYTDPGVCEDGVKSTSSERVWSYQACDNKASVKCSCNGLVNSKGEGECRSTYRGRPFCYTNPGLCSDEVESTASGGWWSYKACDSNSPAATTEKPNSQVLFPEQPIVEQRICKCNGRLNSRGEGECGSTYRGRAFCYVTQGLCQDEVASTADGWWSYQACQQEKNKPGTTLRPSIEAPSPEQPREQAFEDIFVENNPRAPLTAANYCPDQCSVLPDGSTACLSSQCAMPTCQYEGREYNVGDTFWANEADICSNRCECKAIFVSRDPLKVGGAVDCQVVSCTTCTHMDKRYPVGPFNDGCSDCICDEFGGVTCKPTSGSGISPRNNPECIHVNSGDPLVDSVDLEVNSRVTFVSIEKDSRNNVEPDQRINSSENSTVGQITLPKVSADIIPDALLEELEKCPLEQPSIGTPCSLPPGLECTYGEECCCGECSPSLVLSCFEGSWGGFNTDFCFRSGGDGC